MKQSGFTMIEMITTMIIIGILAAVVAPRFFIQQSYSDRGFYDQTLAITRFAQKSAIAIRRNVCVNVASPSISLTYASAAGSGSACDTNLPSPVGGSSPFTITAPTGTTLSPSTTITFTGLGSAASTTTLTVSSRTVTIESGTGYVH